MKSKLLYRLIVPIILLFISVILPAQELSGVPADETFPWVVRTRVETELREGPGTNFKSLGTLDPGAAMYAIARTDDGVWVKVQFHEHTRGKMVGYIEGRNLEFINQLNPDPKPKSGWEPINLDGTVLGTVFGTIWSIIKVILVIALIVVIITFKEELAALLSTVLICAGIGGLIGWLIFKNGGTGAGIGAIVGVIVGLRYLIGFEWLGGILAAIMMVWYYIVSFPFYVLNQAQYILSEPWRYAYKKDPGNDSAKPALRSFLEVIKVILYILITPLRLINAIYYNLFIHCTVMLYDLVMEVIVPCNEKEGAGSIWLWLLLFPWRVIWYPVFHGVVTLIESALWTVIDVFVPAITLYHGTDLIAGQSIAGSRSRNESLSWKSGTFTASKSSWGGIGVYFAARRSVAMAYARSPYRLSDNNPVVIVCRVSLGRIINYSLAPSYVYNAAGQNGNPATLNKFAEKNRYTTGEWWNEHGGYWEYCLFDWKDLYNSRWRIRPIYIYNDRTNFIQHVKGGMAHWTFKF